MDIYDYVLRSYDKVWRHALLPGPGGQGGAALAVTGRVKIIKRATSLGGVESLLEYRASMEGPGSKTPENLLRLSVGLEHSADLMEDLDKALTIS